ncbi:MAG: DNA polymerase III subunit delta [Candidatus Tyrphobacter sp.]
MNFYDFLDKRPEIGRLVVVEGEEQALIEAALSHLLERLLPAEVRDLNLERVPPESVGDGARLRESVCAMPFLAQRRVVLVSDAQTLRAAERRTLLEVAQSVPQGNTLVVVDSLSPRSQRPEPFGSMVGRAALRIDTTASGDARRRFVLETLERLGAKAEPRAVAALVAGNADLAAIRNDLEKLAVAGKRIALADLERETLVVEDPKAYRYAGALLEGRTKEAFAIVAELFERNPRGAAIPLLSALATECSLLWDLARPKGRAPARFRWRERALAPIARRVGASRARSAYQRAVNGLEAIVTGRGGSDPQEYRTLVERISAECAMLARRS